MDKRRVQTDPKHYSQLTEQMSPPSNMTSGLINAFWVGGLICLIGQAIADIGTELLDMTSRDAATFSSIVLVCLFHLK